MDPRDVKVDWDKIVDSYCSHRLSSNRRRMELTWHKCTDDLPEEAYNPCLYVTDGNDVFAVTWKTERGWKRFERGGWYIEPGVNSDGYWWADLVQTVRGFAPKLKYWNL